MKKIAPFLLLGILAAVVAVLVRGRRPQEVVEEMATIDLDHPERTINDVDRTMPVAGGIRP